MTAELSAAMREAVALAARGRGEVEPNPRVGAVVLDGDRVVGRGWHAAYGGPHAEVEAMRDAGGRGDTLVVTLEPCSTQGKTPPCTGSIAAAGIRRVVYGCEDPSPEHRGRARALLRERGIEVTGGVLAEEAESLLSRFRKALALDRPWVVAKWAMTLDGKIATATGDSRWVTAEETRARAAEERGRFEAVAVGVGTVLADDPLLTARPPSSLPRPPLRVVFDSRLRTHPSARIVREGEAPTLFLAAPEASPARAGVLRKAGAEVWAAPARDRTGRVPIGEALRELRRRGVLRLLLESGGALAAAFFEARCVDQVLAYVSTKVAGGSEAPGPVGGEGVPRMAEALRLEEAWFESVGEDFRIGGFVP